MYLFIYLLIYLFIYLFLLVLSGGGDGCKSRDGSGG